MVTLVFRDRVNVWNDFLYQLGESIIISSSMSIIDAVLTIPVTVLAWYPIYSGDQVSSLPLLSCLTQIKSYAYRALQVTSIIFIIIVSNVSDLMIHYCKRGSSDLARIRIITMYTIYIWSILIIVRGRGYHNNLYWCINHIGVGI